MGDEGCCLGKEVQETSCFGFFPQTVSMFCLKMITFETHNYFLEKGSFLSRVLESFPDSLLVSVRPVFLPPEAENLRKKIKGATSKDYLCVSKNLLGCLNSHSNPWVWDTCLSLCLTNDRLMLIKKSPEVWKRPFLWKFLFDWSSPLTIHGCIYLTEVNHIENAEGNAWLPSQLLQV